MGWLVRGEEQGRNRSRHSSMGPDTDSVDIQAALPVIERPAPGSCVPSCTWKVELKLAGGRRPTGRRQQRCCYHPNPSTSATVEQHGSHHGGR